MRALAPAGDLKKEKLVEYFSNQSNPAGKNGMINYNHTKNIDGVGSVTLQFDDYGLPDFREWIPDVPKDKIIYVSDNLKTGAPDFRNANRFVAEKFGHSGSFRVGETIRVQSDNGVVFEWTPNGQNFYLTNLNGDRIKYTWHHHQDGRTLIPVDSRIHSPGEGGFNHSGGEGILRPFLNDGIDLKGFFDSPNY